MHFDTDLRNSKWRKKGPESVWPHVKTLVRVCFQNSHEKFIQPSQTLKFDREQLPGYSRSRFRALHDNIKWTWKCWARGLCNEIFLSKLIKRFTIILFLVCAILFVVIIIFGEPLELLRLTRQPSNFPRVDPPRKPMKPLEIVDLDKILHPANQKLSHVNGVRIEEDGKLNKEYRKELFLGNQDDAAKTAEQDIDKKLENIFHKIDVDKDERLDVMELEVWILAKVQDHLSEDSTESTQLFKFLDKDSNGLVSWKEYFQEFLKSKGHSDIESVRHTEDYESIHMETKEKDQLIRLKFRWSGADRPPQDNQLNLDEFRDFRHPEQSLSMLDHMSNDIINKLDHDRNGFVSEYEFVANPEDTRDSGSPGDLARSDKLWREERRLEFRQIVDSDKDGIVTKEELMQYVDPRNPTHARNEARHLLDQADTNRDSWLTLAEILQNKNVILGSKIVNVEQSFHDEF